jgi:hypothetical protein
MLQGVSVTVILLFVTAYLALFAVFFSYRSLTNCRMAGLTFSCKIGGQITDDEHTPSRRGKRQKRTMAGCHHLVSIGMVLWIFREL